jgi:hypothetical protein
MDRKKRLIFKYFDMTYKGYKKHGRRPVNMTSPHVLFEYKNDDGRTAFEYNTEKDEIRFDYGDLNTAKNMFGIFIADLADICKEYVAYKLDEPKASYSIFIPKNY